MHLLLVEDDAKLAALTVRFLQSHGFETTLCGDGKQALALALAQGPALIILDWMLPSMTGLEVCQQLREKGFQGGILMMTAREDVLDEITGLQQGADDYLRKPVRPSVLLTRVQSLLRRLTHTMPTVRVGKLTINQTRRQVFIDDIEQTLTTADFELLVVLAKNVGKIVTRDDLSLAMRGVLWDGLDRSIDLRVSRLRKKLGTSKGTWIKSIRGSGYLFNVPK